MKTILGSIVRWFVREANTGRAEAALRAKQKFEFEWACIKKAAEWVNNTPVCPTCKTPDGLLKWVQDGMEVRGNYCHDPLYWHAAICKVGTYSGTKSEDALIEIGKRLSRSAS